MRYDWKMGKTLFKPGKSGAKNRNIWQWLLIGICMSAVSISVYSTLTLGQALLHSDDAALVILAKLQMETGEIFPANWNSSNGTVYILDLNSIIAALLPFVHNLSFMRQMASAVAILVAVFAVYRHERMFGHDGVIPSWLLSIPVILLFLNCTRGNGVERDMTLYQAAYIPQLIWLIVFCILFYKAANGYGKPYIVLVMLLILMLSATSVRWLAELVAPMFLYICLKMLLENYGKELRKTSVRALWSRHSKPVFILIVPAIFGMLIYRHISNSRNVNITSLSEMRFSMSLEQCANNIGVMIRNLVSIFGYTGEVRPFSFYGLRNVVSLGVCLIVIFAVPVMQAVRYRDEDDYARYFIEFGFLHNLIMIIMCIFFDKIIDRYLLSTVFVSILISCRFISKYFLGRIRTVGGALLIAVFSGFVLLEGCIVIRQGAGWKDRVAEAKQLCGEISGYGVEKGYATFLNANKNIVFSDYRLRIGSIEIVNGEIRPQYWLTDSDFFAGTDRKSFLLLTQDESSILSGYMAQSFGKPAEANVIHDMNLYIYDYDIGRSFR